MLKESLVPVYGVMRGWCCKVFGWHEFGFKSKGGTGMCSWCDEFFYVDKKGKAERRIDPKSENNRPTRRRMRKGLV
jgi:hypothetical protein